MSNKDSPNDESRQKARDESRAHDLLREERIKEAQLQKKRMREKIEILEPLNLVEILHNPTKWKEMLKKTYEDPNRYSCLPEIFILQIPLTTNVNLRIKLTLSKTGSGEQIDNLTVEFDLVSKNNNRDVDTFFYSNIGALAFNPIIRLLDLEISEKSNDYFFATTRSGNLIKISIFRNEIIVRFEQIDNIESMVGELWECISVISDILVQIECDESLPENPLVLTLQDPFIRDARKTQLKPKIAPDRQEPVEAFDVESFRIKPEALDLNSIGGNKKVKEEIWDLIQYQSNREYFETQRGIELPSGYLFNGPPGTGKTLAARVIASSLGIPFYSFTSADLQTVFAGNTAKIMKKIFAEVLRPGVILFDEIDGIASRFRTSSREVSNQLLVEMSVISKNGLIVIGATNSLQDITPALLRPGRLGNIIEFSIPDESEREEIFYIYLKQILDRSKVAIFDEESLAPDLIKEYVAKMDGFSGAEIEELLRRVNLKSGIISLSDSEYLADSSLIFEIIETIKKEKQLLLRRDIDSNVSTSLTHEA